MGFKHGFRRLAVAATLVCATVAQAEQTEPLVVTKLGDPELRVVAMSDPEQDLDDQAMARFAAAIDQAAIELRQAGTASCKSSAPVPPTGAARLAWEANCRYHRR